MACWRSPEARWGVRRLVDVIRVVRHRPRLWRAITATRDRPAHAPIRWRMTGWHLHPDYRRAVSSDEASAVSWGSVRRPEYSDITSVRCVKLHYPPRINGIRDVANGLTSNRGCQAGRGTMHEAETGGWRGTRPNGGIPWATGHGSSSPPGR
jgi:hypothetical protein